MIDESKQHFTPMRTLELAIIQLHKDGHKNSEIARILNVHPSLVKVTLEKLK